MRTGSEVKTPQIRPRRIGIGNTHTRRGVIEQDALQVRHPQQSVFAAVGARAAKNAAMNISAFVMKSVCGFYDRISGDTRELLVQKCAITAQTKAVDVRVLAVTAARLVAESQGIYREPSD